MTSNEISKWSDKAMFKAAPLRGSDGPSVSVVSCNPDPLGEIASTAMMYIGKVVGDLAQVTDDDRRFYLDQIRQTKLKAPMEFVRIHMLLENVHRGLTHQLVRQRTAVYAQESMRFAVKEGMSVSTHLPPSLAQFNDPDVAQELLDRVEGARDRQDYLYPQSLTDDERNYIEWIQVTARIQAGYDNMVDRGMPAEDARGIAPTNIGTRVHYSTDLRALLDHAGNRLCTQAQFEWRQLWAQILPAIRSYGERQTYRTTVDGEVTVRSSKWQFDALADIFRPACYLTGKCEFAAMDLDRACSIRDRVDAFAAHGVKSSEWGEPKLVFMPMPEMPGQMEEGVLDPIHPAEWAADPTAARVRA